MSQWDIILSVDFDDLVNAKNSDEAVCVLRNCLPPDVVEALDVLDESDRVDLAWNFERIDPVEFRANFLRAKPGEE